MKKFSFDTMRAAVKLSFDNIKTGHWTKKNAEDYPEIFELPQLPPYFSFNKTVDVSIFTDAYIHTLFLGCMKAITSIIKSCVKYKQKTQFFLCKLEALNNLHSPNVFSQKSAGTEMSFGNHLSQY